ncbi:hypothetical protein VTI74DRAFT_10956 [Chaetomium olivicolor]
MGSAVGFEVVSLGKSLRTARNITEEALRLALSTTLLCLLQHNTISAKYIKLPQSVTYFALFFVQNSPSLRWSCTFFQAQDVKIGLDRSGELVDGGVELIHRSSLHADVGRDRPRACLWLALDLGTATSLDGRRTIDTLLKPCLSRPVEQGTGMAVLEWFMRSKGCIQPCRAVSRVPSVRGGRLISGRNRRRCRSWAECARDEVLGRFRPRKGCRGSRLAVVGHHTRLHDAIVGGSVLLLRPTAPSLWVWGQISKCHVAL